MNTDTAKPVQVLVLDAGPLLTNQPPISTLLTRSEKIFTVPSVLSEIKDHAARTRLETTVLPFLTLRAPIPASIKVITDFAQKTGDLSVLSGTDVKVLALAYELEIERNHGDWRLRRVPGQKGLNGTPPSRQPDDALASPKPPGLTKDDGHNEKKALPTSNSTGSDAAQSLANNQPRIPSLPQQPTTRTNALEEQVDCIDLRSVPYDEAATIHFPGQGRENQNLEDAQPLSSNDGSDLEGWITPSNLKKHQLHHQNGSASPIENAVSMQVAIITGDFAMQNVLLQMNLNLLSPSMARVRHLKTYVLRCHACFEKTKDMSKQFCPRCGKPTLTRVACSTNANGEFQIHLKKNMQWNTRGDRFSIPKPVSGSANGKLGTHKGGGKKGWGQGLILAEDQNEYLQAIVGQSRRKERNLMDEDYLPGILTGDRGKPGRHPKIGGGRNVNSKKR